MEIRYNVKGDRRKALVKVISNAIGTMAVYNSIPTFSYEIGCFTVTRDGTLIFDDGADSEKVLEAIAAAGFDREPAQEAEQAETEDPAQESPTTETEDPAQESPTTETEEPAQETDGLVISLPLDGFTPDSLERLRKLIDSKEALIRKALNADRLAIQTSDGTVRFPWWDALPGSEEIQAYTAFIAALCRMAKTATRVTPRETEVESERYAFRSFLLRLGFIGADSKVQRKLLLKNLSGSAAFPNKEKADAFSLAQKAKRDAAKAASEEVQA